VPPGRSIGADPLAIRPNVRDGGSEDSGRLLEVDEQLAGREGMDEGVEVEDVEAEAGRGADCL